MLGVTREKDMRTKTLSYFVVLLLMVSAFGSGCSKLFGPSDAEVINAIDESGVLKGVTLQSPIVILEKRSLKRDVWAVKVNVVFTYETAKGQVSAPSNRTPTFYVSKAKDSTGHAVWKASLNP
jgi:hypothetical protein